MLGLTAKLAACQLDDSPRQGLILPSITHAGFRLHVFTNAHPPPHAHAFRDKGQVRVALLPDGDVELLEVLGRLSDRDVRAAVDAVRGQHAWLSGKWEHIHGVNAKPGPDPDG